LIIFGVAFLLFLPEFGKAQSGGAQVYSGSSSYNSTAYGSIGYGSTANSIVLDFNPVFVAQNSEVHTVTPSITGSIPTGSADSVFIPTPILTPSTPVNGSSLILQPFDPYAVPTSLPTTSGSTILGLGTASYNGNSAPVGSSGIYSGNFERLVPETYEAMRRFREATRFDFAYLPGGKKSNSFGMSEINLRLQLGFPCRFIPSNGSGTGFFYVAPGANLLWWNGPAGPPHMSPNGFGAFLDFGMQPQFNEVFSLNAWFRFGVFSDFKRISSDSFSYQGRLEGLFNVDPKIQIIAGIIYLDRQRHKILPTVGVVWTLRDDLVLKLTFPNPKISKRLWNSGSAEWWGYVQGDYGGGCWSIDGIGRTDYNDVKIGAGIEFETQTRIGGYFECGGSFARELYSHGQKWAKPPNVLYLKTGIIF
jgi:hypothetical protein